MWLGRAFSVLVKTPSRNDAEAPPVHLPEIVDPRRTSRPSTLTVISSRSPTPMPLAISSTSETSGGRIGGGPPLALDEHRAFRQHGVKVGPRSPRSAQFDSGEACTYQRQSLPSPCGRAHWRRTTIGDAGSWLHRGDEGPSRRADIEEEKAGALSGMPERSSRLMARSVSASAKTR